MLGDALSELFYSLHKFPQGAYPKTSLCDNLFWPAELGSIYYISQPFPRSCKRRGPCAVTDD